MTILTASQIYDLAQQAGFTGQDAINATAVALAESSGNTSVVNSIGAMGLWQIYDGSYPSAARIAQMSDPLANAKAAYAKFAASQQTVCGGWWPWASYNEGPCHNSDPDRNNTWRNYLSDVPAGGASASGSSGGADSLVSSSAALVSASSAGTSSAPSLFGSDALGKIVARLSSSGFWWSVGFFVLAGVLIVVGLLVYFHKQVEQVVGKAGEAAAVAAAA